MKSRLMLKYIILLIVIGSLIALDALENIIKIYTGYDVQWLSLVVILGWIFWDEIKIAFQMIRGRVE